MESVPLGNAMGARSDPILACGSNADLPEGQDGTAGPLSPSDCRVTIGMPVYNGGRHIEQAISSILQQTYRDFRLIVLDNASTDATEEIVRGLARLDPRIVYRRNSVNIGAQPNYNRVFELADSPYFKWAAHDDELYPTFLERCVDALDTDASAVLAMAAVEEIDDRGLPIRVCEPVPAEAASNDRLERFRGRVLCRGSCAEIFGLVRAETLRRTMLMQGSAAADLALLTELALHGRCALVREPLFRNRIHPRRYTAAVFESNVDGAGRRNVLAWQDRTKLPRWWHDLHWWIFFLGYFPMIRRAVQPQRERWRYYLMALRWLTVRNNVKDLAKDLLYLASPRLLERAVRLSRSRQAPAGAGLEIGPPR